MVLARDLPEHYLRKGDLGTIVAIHEPDCLEVEFLTATGSTEAVLTLTIGDVRPGSDDDLISVRSQRRSA